MATITECAEVVIVLHEAEAFVLSIAATKCLLQEYSVCICESSDGANRTVFVKLWIDRDGRLSILHTERMMSYSPNKANHSGWYTRSLWRATEQLPNKLTETSHRLPLSQAERGSHRTTAVYEDSAKSSTGPNYWVHRTLPRLARRLSPCRTTRFWRIRWLFDHNFDTDRLAEYEHLQ